MTEAELERRRRELDRRLVALAVKVPSAGVRRRSRSAATAAATTSTRPAVELEDRWLREAAQEAHTRGHFVRVFETKLEVH